MIFFWIIEVTVGFASLNYMVEEDAGSLEVCLKTSGAAPLSQAGFLRVKTLSGSAEGIIMYKFISIIKNV